MQWRHGTRMLVATAALLSVGLPRPAVQAADPRLSVTVDGSRLPDSYKTPSGLYLTATEAHRAVTTLQGVLMIDVRTHGETLFGGVAGPMHRHIPYMMPDIDRTYDAAAGRYRLEPNPDFVKAVRNLLTERGLDDKATLILYCSVGERSARAASLLQGSGFTNTYSMADGFEGEPANKVGPGWKAAGLPWSTRLRPEQAYKSPSM